MPAIPERYAEEYLGSAPSLVWLLVANATAFVVGLAFYATAAEPYGRRLAEVPTFVYPLYADSPVALALSALALATLLPNLGRSLDDAPVNRPLAYLHTLAFVWLVKFGLWTAVALGSHPRSYALAPDAAWAFWGITLTHLAFVGEAYLLPHAGRTTRGALVVALVALLVNDAVDYLLGFHPPLRYDPGLPLTVASVALSVLAVALAARAFDRLDDADDTG